MTEKRLKIEEIVVVEGKDDTSRIQLFVDADTIETVGSAINEETLQKIEQAEEVRGVIIFTDPDFAGEKIRKTIMARVPSAKHAFLSRADGRPKHRGSLGVEHASEEAIIAALSKVSTPQLAEYTSEMTRDLLFRKGLIAGENAKVRRERLGELLGIGYTNGKQLMKRLEMFRVTRSDFDAAMKQILKEEVE